MTGWRGQRRLAHLDRAEHDRAPLAVGSTVLAGGAMGVRAHNALKASMRVYMQHLWGHELRREGAGVRYRLEIGPLDQVEPSVERHPKQALGHC